MFENLCELSRITLALLSRFEATKDALPNGVAYATF